MAKVEATAVRMHASFWRTLGWWEAEDCSYDDLPAWLEERCEAVAMLEEAGCGLAGWPLDPAEQDPLAHLRPLVVCITGGLTVAVNGIVHIHAVVRGWIDRREYGTDVASIVRAHALAWRWLAHRVARWERGWRCGPQLSLELVALVPLQSI